MFVSIDLPPTNTAKCKQTFVTEIFIGIVISHEAFRTNRRVGKITFLLQEENNCFKVFDITKAGEKREVQWKSVDLVAHAREMIGGGTWGQKAGVSRLSRETWHVWKCPPWPIPQKGGTLYSGARYVALWASCWCSDLDFAGWPTFTKKLSLTITFETEGLLIVAIYKWLPPASYVVFLTTLVKKSSIFILFEISNQKNIN